MVKCLGSVEDRTRVSKWAAKLKEKSTTIRRH